MPPQVTIFRMGPGDGIYIPPYAFHWVLGGPDVSVALSCGFRSPSSERAEMVHTFNVKLRKVGMSPSLPGRFETTDRAKAGLVQARRRFQSTPLEKALVVARAKVSRWAGRGAPTVTS